MVGRGEQVQVGVGKPAALQARRHPLGGQRAAAGRERGVGLDQLLVEAAELLLVGAQRLRGRGLREHDE